MSKMRNLDRIDIRMDNSHCTDSRPNKKRVSGCKNLYNSYLGHTQKCIFLACFHKNIRISKPNHSHQMIFGIILHDNTPHVCPILENLRRIQIEIVTVHMSGYVQCTRDLYDGNSWILRPFSKIATILGTPRCTVEENAILTDSLGWLETDCQVSQLQ